MSSARDYAILWFGARSGSGTGLGGLGGNALLAVPQHKLDGAEHLAPDDTTRLDATTARHGLVPKLPGSATVFLDGTGGFSSPSGGTLIPTLLAPGELFSVPDDRQALFALPIVLGAGAGFAIGSNAALVEVD